MHIKRLQDRKPAAAPRVAQVTDNSPREYIIVNNSLVSHLGIKVGDREVNLFPAKDVALNTDKDVPTFSLAETNILRANPALALLFKSGKLIPTLASVG